VKKSSSRAAQKKSAMAGRRATHAAKLTASTRSMQRPSAASAMLTLLGAGGRWLRLLVLATRPAFLLVTLTAVLLGLACAAADGVHIAPLSAGLTLLFALVAHAGANAINDYYDRDNDAGNIERVYPFTGGSRFIQRGLLTPRATAWLGYGLLLLVVPAGLWLTWHAGAGLLWIGLAGLLIGWGYSAPPLALASRGLGELAIVGGWLLVVVGSDYVQRGAFAPLPWQAGCGYALLVANLLYINQFPDATADAAAGKRTLVVRLGRRRARLGFIVIAALSALCVPLGVACAVLPAPTFLAWLSLPFSIAAARGLWHHAETPARLAPAIKAALAAAQVYGLLLAVGLLLGRW
jgi:1,4-dihydroxy-2-naphthoate octaprenyltransferase